MKELLLSYDIGTTGAKAALFKKDATLLGSAYKPYNTYYPRLGYVEQRPEDWWKAVIESTCELMEKIGFNPAEVVGISFSGQMMGQVPVAADGTLLQEQVPIWIDGRASEQVEVLFKKLGGYERFYEITMQGHNPQLYTLFRVMWYRDNIPEVFKKTYKFLHSKEFIANRMTGNFATDYTDQALSATINMKKRTWSDEMFDAAGSEITRDCFPELHESIDVMGSLTNEAAKQLNLVEGIPVVVGSGDGPAAAAGSAALERGDAYFYIGSACWGGTIETEPIGDFETKVIVHNHLVPGLYHSQYVMYTGAIAQQWAIETLYGDAPKGVDLYKQASDAARKIPLNQDTVLFLPYMRPGGAPYNNLNARGVFTGIGLNHSKEHLFRAVLEGVAFNIRLFQTRFEKFRGMKLPTLNIVGGGSRNPFWMQLISDITGRKITTSSLQQEANTFAAAQCAGVGVGVYKDFKEVRKLIRIEQEYVPNESTADFYESKFEAFLKAYQGMVETYDLIAKLDKF